MCCELKIIGIKCSQDDLKKKKNTKKDIKAEMNPTPTPANLETKYIY